MRKGFRIIKFKKSKPILNVKDVNKSFDGRPILKNIFGAIPWRNCGSFRPKRFG